MYKVFHFVLGPINFSGSPFCYNGKLHIDNLLDSTICFTEFSHYTDGPKSSGAFVLEFPVQTPPYEQCIEDICASHHCLNMPLYP